jgi:hypothetical protein
MRKPPPRYFGASPPVRNMHNPHVIHAYYLRRAQETERNAAKNSPLAILQYDFPQ